MSGSDVSREDGYLDEGQFSDADDEAVEVRTLQLLSIVAAMYGLQGSLCGGILCCFREQLFAVLQISIYLRTLSTDGLARRSR